MALRCIRERLRDEASSCKDGSGRPIDDSCRISSSRNHSVSVSREVDATVSDGIPAGHPTPMYRKHGSIYRKHGINDAMIRSDAALLVGAYVDSKSGRRDIAAHLRDRWTDHRRQTKSNDRGKSHVELS